MRLDPRIQLDHRRRIFGTLSGHRDAYMNQDEALRWIAELFEEAPTNITPETVRDAIPTWDSLGVLTLMAALNERFDVVMNTEELAGMRKVNDILQVLRHHGKMN